MFEKIGICILISSVCFMAQAQEKTVESSENAPVPAVDTRIQETLQKTLEKDVNLGAYETKLVYRQMLKGQNEQKNKKQTLKQMADTFNYDENQLQQAEALYDNGEKPVNYQIPSNEEGAFVASIDTNPAQALKNLAGASPINQQYLPSHLKKKASLENEQQVMKKSVSQTPADTTTQAPVSRRPVQSVRNINLRPTGGTVKKKRLGVKSYAINPENFY